MKLKVKTLLAAGMALGTLGATATVANSLRPQKLEQATANTVIDGVTKYIEMNADAFSTWDAAAGTFAAKDATYWPDFAGYSEEDGNSFNYPFQALDTFFRGESNEGWKGTLVLKTWTQYSQYIYFTWGGAKDYDVTGEVKLLIHYGDKTYTMFNNTFMDNQMLLRYFRIPDADYASLDKTNGFNMYIELVDDRSDGYGFHNFGYLHPNATLEEVGDAMRYYLNNLSKDSRNSQRRMKKAILDNYFANSGTETGLRDVFYRAVADVTDGFDSQSDFLNHWYFDHSYFNYSNPDIHPDKAISTGKVRPGNSGMPFNVTGDAFFRGWYENSLDSGFVDGDGSTYRFISRPVTLTGDCIVSIKMAGTASFHVIDATVRPNDNQAADLAWIDNRVYSTAGGEILTSGFNTCTMVRHVINLSAYKNRTVQFAIADISPDGWGAAYFDDLQVNVDLTSVGFKAEALTQVFVGSGTYYPVYLDQYVNSQHIDGNPTGIKYKVSGDAVADASDARAAYNYVHDYYNFVRTSNGQNNTCDNNFRYGNDMKSLINGYNALANANIKKIVCASDDYQRASGTWQNSPVTVFSLGQSIKGIAFDNNISVDIYTAGANRNVFGFTSESTAIIAIISAFAIISIFALAFVLAKKKRKATK